MEDFCAGRARFSAKHLNDIGKATVLVIAGSLLEICAASVAWGWAGFLSSSGAICLVSAAVILTVVVLED